MASAVVLGGGGIAGVAWEAGLLLGLHRAGIGVASADIIVGTSAGSIVGSCLASSGGLEALAAGTAARAGAGAREGAATGPGTGGDLDAALALLAPLFDPALDPQTARRQVGAAALAADAGGEAEYLEQIAALLPQRDHWPQRRLLVTGVDTGSGEPAVWDSGSGVPLDRAVAASCAVPGVFPPVTIGGRRYMDGGIRSVTNADLAAGASVVIVLNALGYLIPGEQLAAELASLGAASTHVIRPDETAAALMGVSLMDPATAPPILEAALAQAASCAGDVSAAWPAG